MLYQKVSLLDYTNLFSPNKYDKNDKKMLKYFQWLKTKNLFYENTPNMAEENINQKVRLKNIEEITNSFIKDIHQNKLISNKHIKVCKTKLY